MILTPSRSAIAVVALATALLVACIPGAASARRGCGDVEQVKATKDVNPGGPEPLVVGDSVMLLALSNLAGVGYDTNGQGCRSFAEGLGVMRSTRRAAKLPRLVALALGTDGRVGMGQIRKALRIAGPERVLGLVTPHELGGGAGFDASVMRKAANQHPTRIVLFDWVRYSRGHHGWFQPDHAHLAYKGAAAFARLLAMGSRFSRPGQTPHHTRFPRGGHSSSGSRGGSKSRCQGMRVTIGGTSHADRISGTKHRDVIDGGAGDDEIHGKGGNDVVCAGRGRDFVFGGPGSDRIDGGDNSDSLHGNEGRDRLRGQRGSDYLAGAQDGDRIIGGPDGRTRAGADVAAFGGHLAPVHVDLGRGVAHGQGIDRLVGIEGVMGSTLPDTIVGDDGANVLSGSAGTDVIRGAGGDDLINGGPSEDVVHGDGGDDRILGYYGDDQLYGDRGADSIEGYSGADTIFGGPGADTLAGDEGDDSLFGMRGDDDLYGDIHPCAGASCAIGGHDLLDGGSGAEVAGDYGDGGPFDDTCTNLESFTACEP